MAALKLSLIQKYKLEYSYTYVYSTGFLSPACPEQGARALLLTRREEAPGAYTVLVQMCIRDRAKSMHQKKMNLFLRVLFIILIIAISGAAILQIFAPEYMGRHAAYGISIGWQDVYKRQG